MEQYGSFPFFHLMKNDPDTLCSFLARFLFSVLTHQAVIYTMGNEHIPSCGKMGSLKKGQERRCDIVQRVAFSLSVKNLQNCLAEKLKIRRQLSIHNLNFKISDDL